MNPKILYDEWKKLKLESISYQRAGADGYMSETMHKRDSYVYDRIKDIEKLMFPLLTDREILVFDNIEQEQAERQQDKFYTGNYLVDYIKIKDELKYDKGLVSGEIIYAKVPQ